MKKFSANKLEQIYTTIVKHNNSYFTKHKRLPSCPIKSWNYQWGDKDMPRNFCVLDFIEWVQKHDISSGNTLGITCPTDMELEFLNYKNTTTLSYPPYDLHELYDQFINVFDFFVFNQTIEHLYNPFIVIENIYQYVKPGGYVFTSVPTINIPHMTPIHYNGYNPMGLAILFISAGFDVVECGQWGNHEYINKLFKTHCWPGADKVSHVNEERNVVQCWILVRKPQ
jgi:SAM-dependent methyltransferase